jgi:DNA polymerase-3 subunit epsilon
VILFVDTETSGLVKPHLSESHSDQPHLVQLGLLLCDERWDGRAVGTLELIVRPDGYAIPAEASNVHGITTEIAERSGVPLAVALSAFIHMRARADRLVAHNLDFDDLVMRAAIHRSGRKPSSPGPTDRACTMRMAGEIMKLPPTARMKAAGFDKYKPPNLMEAYEYFTGKKFEGAHGALADCRACAAVYFAILKRKRENGEEATAAQ